jgi:GAF domain-containing protein
MASRASSSASFLHRMAEEVVALRRLASLLASGASPSQIFSAVAGEVGGMLGADHIWIARYEPGSMVEVVASWQPSEAPHLDVPFGGRWPVTDQSPAGSVLRTGRAARCAVDPTDSAMAAWVKVARTATPARRCWAQRSGFRERFSSGDAYPTRPNAISA